MNPGAMEFLPGNSGLPPPTPQRVVNPEEDTSSPSTISDHFSTNKELANKPDMIFTQASHPSSFKKIDMAGFITITEAYSGAIVDIRSLNPEYFSMSFGTRVVNGKTEHYQNIVAAIRNRKWSTIANSSKRIMDIYEARHGNDDKLILLLSVNGTQQYCALAEIVGPWEPDNHVDGWMERTGGAGVVGSFPITLRFVKNVPFSLFGHIKQDRNNHSVLNMWDGMRFDSDAGREVVKTYVEAPHFTNLLAWPSDGSDNRIPAGCPYRFQVAGPFGGPKHIQDSRERNEREGLNNPRAVRDGSAWRGRGDTNMTHGGMGRGRGVALASNNWRDRGNQLPAIDTEKAQQHRNMTVVRHVPSMAQISTELAQMQLDGTNEKLATTRQPKYFSCVEDQNGDYIPVPSGIPDTVLCVTSADGKLVPFDFVMAKPDTTIKTQSHDPPKGYAQVLQHAASTNVLVSGAAKARDVCAGLGSSPALVGNPTSTVRNTASANAIMPHIAQRNSQAFANPSAGLASAGLRGNRTSARVLKAQRSALPAGFVFGDHTDATNPGFCGEHGGATGVEMPRHSPMVVYTGDAEATPVPRTGVAKSQTVDEKMGMWMQNTSTAYEGAEMVQRPTMPTPRTASRSGMSIADSLKGATADELMAFGDQIPASKRGTFFGLLLEKDHFKKQLASMSREDQSELFRVRMQAHEVDKLLDRLVFDDDFDEAELAALHNSWSSDRASTLGPDDSINHGSDRPFTKQPLSEFSWDSGVRRTVDSLVNSTSSSEVVMKGRGTHTRFVSNPFEVLSDDGEGGARLE